MGQCLFKDVDTNGGKVISSYSEPNLCVNVGSMVHVYNALGNHQKLGALCVTSRTTELKSIQFVMAMTAADGMQMFRENLRSQLFHC